MLRVRSLVHELTPADHLAGGRRVEVALDDDGLRKAGAGNDSVDLIGASAVVSTSSGNTSASASGGLGSTVASSSAGGGGSSGSSLTLGVLTAAQLVVTARAAREAGKRAGSSAALDVSRQI